MYEWEPISAADALELLSKVPVLTFVFIVAARRNNVVFDAVCAVVFRCECARVCRETPRNGDRRRTRFVHAAARASDVDRRRSGRAGGNSRVAFASHSRTQQAPERATIASPLVNFVLRRASQSALLANFLQWSVIVVCVCMYVYVCVYVCVCVCLKSSCV